MGKSITGIIVDNDNQEITQITTRHLGMGAFILIPKEGKTYQAKLTYEDGSQSTVALPKALDQGYVMNLNSNLADDSDHVA